MHYDLPSMSKNDIEAALNEGCEQCVVEAKSAGSICWDITDTRDREPVHEVSVGDRFWCWNFQETEDGYTHDYANMAPTGVSIKTDVDLELVYVTSDSSDLALYQTQLDKCPNWT
ncbi:hypothetical protein [Vibrio alginolyticus]|uniref:hypothetical protein n=1 Tax=Vibrio alginolyticus TaxID=663 RepID=UPI0015F55A05|nr:hypothetical protein [Vibrio alginolyticus]